MVEMTLEELLADPLIRQLMRRDGLVEFEVRVVMTRAREGLNRLRRLAADQSCPPQLNGSFGAVF